MSKEKDKSIVIDGNRLPLIDVVCNCSTYEVVPMYGWGRCGKCGVKPEPIPKEASEEDDY